MFLIFGREHSYWNFLKKKLAGNLGQDPLLFKFASTMKTNQNVIHGFHAGLASQSSAMLQAMLAMRACHLGFRMVAKAAWATTWLRLLVC
jgi:hypothetical protein